MKAVHPPTLPFPKIALAPPVPLFSYLIFSICLKNFFYLFIGCAGSMLLCAGFFYLWQERATLQLCCAQAFQCRGFSFCRARALGMHAPVVMVCGLSTCGAWGQLLCSTWNLPRLGIEPVANKFLTTGSLGKSQHLVFRFNQPYMSSVMKERSVE